MDASKGENITVRCSRMNMAQLAKSAHISELPECWCKTEERLKCSAVTWIVSVSYREASVWPWGRYSILGSPAPVFGKETREICERFLRNTPGDARGRSNIRCC